MAIDPEAEATAPPPRVPAPFTPASPDLSELRERHFRLQRERQDLASLLRDHQVAASSAMIPDEATDLLVRAAELRIAACDAGQWIYDLAERDTAQGIADYWASGIASIPGASFPELLTLAPPDPGCRERFVAHADAVMARLSEKEQQLAGDILFSLDPQWGADVPQLVPPDRNAALGSPEAANLRQLLQKAHLIRAIECGPGTVPELVLHHRPLLDRWGVFVTMGADAELDANRRKWLETYAHNWAEDRKRTSILLRGKALREAVEFQGRMAAAPEGRGLSDDAHAFLDASCRALGRRRLSAALSVLMVLLLAVLAWLLVVWAKQQAQSEIANATRDGAAAAQNAAIDTLQDAQLVDQLAPNASAPAQDADPSPATRAAMWIGSSALPLLRDKAGNPADPATLQPGIYRARLDTWLRTEVPDGDYASQPSIGVLPANADVYVLRVAKSYPRPSGIQYWAYVRPVTTVFIHYARGSVDQARAVRVQLAQAGFTMPDVQERPVGQGQYEVRYATQKDQRLAALVMQALLKTAPPGDGARPRCQANPAGGRSSIFEIWIDLSAVARGSGGSTSMPASCTETPGGTDQTPTAAR